MLSARKSTFYVLTFLNIDRNGWEMASRTQETGPRELAVEKAMAGILAVMIDEREQRVQGDKDAPKIEVLLSRAGLSHEDIAAVTGKNANAVRVSLQRAKAKAA